MSTPASRFCAAVKVTASSQREAAFAITRCLDLYPWPDGSGTHHAIRAFTASTSSLVFPGQTASAQPCAVRSGPTRDAPKVSASGSCLGDQQRRVLVISALALLLASRQGERIKHDMNMAQAQPTKRSAVG